MDYEEWHILLSWGVDPNEWEKNNIGEQFTRNDVWVRNKSAIMNPYINSTEKTTQKALFFGGSARFVVRSLKLQKRIENHQPICMPVQGWHTVDESGRCIICGEIADPCARCKQKNNRGVQSTLEWKNTPDLFNDYVYLHECPWAMRQILLRHGWFFDDDYFYWVVKHRKSCYHRHGQIIKRRPLYWYPQKSTPSQKVKSDV